MKKCSLVAIALAALALASAPAFAGAAFGAKTDHGTGTLPYSVAIGDLNGDGKPDLVTANESPGTVSVLLGNGDGTFATKTDFTTGSGAYSVAIGDLNGDGIPDLAVANSGSATVSVLPGNGDGTFGAKRDFATGSSPFCVAIGDLNGDGKADLVTADYNSATVSVLRGNGDGTFGAKTDLATGSHPAYVAIGDVNGDGKLDLVVACNNPSGSVSVLLGNGDGTFGAKTDFTVGANPWSVAIGRLNADTVPDLAVANWGSGTVSVLLGNGDGSFGPNAEFPVGSLPWAVAIGELDGDGMPDLAVANFGSNTVSVLPGIGDGTFGAKTDFGTGSSPRSVAIGDLNRDGRPDLALANAASGSVSVLLAELTPTATALASSPNPSRVGQDVTLTATVTPSTATGSVTFHDGATVLGSATLSSGVATLTVPGLCGDSYVLSASYAGDAAHLGSTSTAINHVVSPAPTTVAVVSGPSPSRLGQAVSFTATVTDSAAGACALTGSVQFYVDSVAFGAPVALAGGSATLAGVTSLAIGTHHVHAVYEGSASFAVGSSPAIPQEVETPRPVLVGVRDVVNDQGGRVKLLWNASYLDLAPYDSVATYSIYRSAPAAAPGAALEGTRAVSGAIAPQVGAFVGLPQLGAAYVWELIAIQPAFHVPNYSYVATTTRDSVVGSNPLTHFVIVASTAGGAQSWTSDPDSGYSVDNLAPATPTHFAGTYAAGVVTLRWNRNAEHDLAGYRLHRGTTADFAPGPGNLVAALSDTTCVDAVTELFYYKICAVDVHGNLSNYTFVLPSGMTGVAGEASLAFALDGARPNPSRGDGLSVAFTLPAAAPARLEVVDVSGRRVMLREVGALGAGRHVVALGAERRFAPGLYLVRLTQGSNVRVSRVAVLK